MKNRQTISPTLSTKGYKNEKKVKKCRKFASSVVATTMVMSLSMHLLQSDASDNSAQESAEKIEFKTAGEDLHLQRTSTV